MNFTLDVELRGKDYEVEVDFVPSDNGDRWTPPSGIEFYVISTSLNGKLVDLELTDEEENKVYEITKGTFESEYGSGREPDDE